MSLLTCFFIWLCVSCVATPFIGLFLGALDSPQDNHSNARAADRGLWPRIDRFGEGAFVVAPVYIPRRKPADYALRNSRRH